MNGCGIFRGYPYNGLCKDGYDWYASAICKFKRANEENLRAGYNVIEYMRLLGLVEIQEELPGSYNDYGTIVFRHNETTYSIRASLYDTYSNNGCVRYDVDVKRPGMDFAEEKLVEECTMDFTLRKIRKDIAEHDHV